MATLETQETTNPDRLVFEGEARQDLWKIIQKNMPRLIIDYPRDYVSAEEVHLAEGLKKTPEPFVEALMAGSGDVQHARLISETLFRVDNGKYLFLKGKENPPNSGKNTITLCSPDLEGKSQEKPPSGIIAFAQTNPGWNCRRFFDTWSVSVEVSSNAKASMGFGRK